MAPDLDSARKDIYSFYQKYAASAYVRSPLYDTKGLKSIDSVVRKCEADSSRAVNVNISTVGNAAYRKLDSDVDHLVFAVKILKNALSDEKLAILMDETSLPTDVFDRKEQISKRSSSLKGLVNKLPNTKNIKITGEIDLKPYSFETNSFELTNLKRNVSTYSYSYKPTVPVGKPTYDIIIPASMMAFKPSSIDEAKMIEKYRSSNKFQLTSYIQASDSDIGPNGTLQVKGVLATIEVSDGKGKTLFTMSAK